MFFFSVYGHPDFFSICFFFFFLAIFFTSRSVAWSLMINFSVWKVSVKKFFFKKMQHLFCSFNYVFLNRRKLRAQLIEQFPQLSEEAVDVIFPQKGDSRLLPQHFSGVQHQRLSPPPALHPSPHVPAADGYYALRSLSLMLLRVLSFFYSYYTEK